MSYADEEKQKFRLSTNALHHLIDSLQSKGEQPKKPSGFRGFGQGYLGLGHHDNLTKTKSYVGPKLKTSNIYWSLYIEGGVGFKMIEVGYFVSGLFPIPRTSIIGGYAHQGEIYDEGVLSRVRFLPLYTKVNLNPIFGYEWINEKAVIYDPKGLKPDSLNLHYKDHGLFYGLGIYYLFRKLNYEEDLGFMFSYLHVDFRENKVNKYRAELGFFVHSIEKNLHSKEIRGYISSFSIGIEYVDWSHGRKDWFVVGSFKASVKT